MTGRKLWYLVALAAFALLPLAGCSGGSGSPVKVGEKGTEITVSGTVEAPKSTAKTTALTAIAANTVEVYDAQDGAKLGGSAIDASGKFSGLAFTLPTTKTILVFKATVAQGTFLSLVPIDLSNPPAAGTISGSNPISIVISQESTAKAQLVSQLLGLTGDLGDAGKTLASVGKDYAAAAQLIVDNGGQQLAYIGSGLALTGKFSSAALLPALNASALTADDLNNIEVVGSVTSVAIPGNKPIVSFQVINKATGKGISGLKTFAFALVQLKPGQSGSADQWQSYMVASATSRPSTESSTTFNTTTRLNAPTAGTSLIDNGDGSYTYVFAKDVKTAQTYMPAYDASLTHRLAIQVRTADTAVKDSSGAVVNAVTNSGVTYGSNFTNAANLIFDFVPASGAPVTGMLQREIVTAAACNECHTKIGVSTPHGGRVDTRFCVVCHTSQRANGRTASASSAGVFTGSTYVADSEVSGEFVTMIHKIHMGSRLTKTGYDYAGVKFNEIVYPKEVTNCRQCHKAGAGAQGDNWQAKPSRKACGSCHDNIDYATGANLKSGGTAHVAQADDSSCNSCHAVTSTTGKMSPENAHLSVNATTNNPKVATGLTNFTYEIADVTVDASNQAVIKFRILASTDGSTPAPVTFIGVGTTASPLLTGFTGGPGFILAYNLSSANQPFTTSSDFNNLGVKAAQPISVNIANLADGTKGTLSTPDASGYYTATITAAASNFPLGAKMRAVGLQSYFTQAAGTNGIAAATARHAISVVKAVTGDATRRSLIDPAKCGSCHEWFEGHGGSRVIGKETVGTPICVLCHVPNLSSSGKGVNVANITKTPSAMSATEQALLTADGFTLLDPTTYPEETNNFKDMIHGIHAGSSRTNPLKFVRDRSTVVMYFSAATFKFPGILKNCQMCHVAPVAPTSSNPGNPSYTGIPADAQVTTDMTTNGTALDLTNNVSVVSASRTSLPNATDLVTTPFTASCVSCHDAPAAKAHMKQNGGQIRVLRSAADPGNEACVTCHGSTGPVSINAVHR